MTSDEGAELLAMTDPAAVLEVARDEGRSVRVRVAACAVLDMLSVRAEARGLVVVGVDVLEVRKIVARLAGPVELAAMPAAEGRH